MSTVGYLKYRDSGVEWLGKIPAHWVVCALKRDVRVQGGYAFKSDDFGEEGEPVVRIGDITSNGYVGIDGCKRVPKSISSPLGTFSVAPGDIVMAMTGATIGKVGKIPKDRLALLNQRVGSFKLTSGRLVYGFLWFILGSVEYLEHVHLTADGGAQPNISDTGMLAYHLAVPPLEEQTQIAKFLDYETAKIDALIAKQQQLIALLQEKRQAVISHAVTKGLNPAAPLRDSGVAWLGQVPAHWRIFPSKRLFPESKKRAHPDDEQLTASQDWGVIPQKEFVSRAGRQVVQINQHLDKRKRVEYNDFVVSMRSFQGGLERAWASGGIRSSYVVLKPTKAVEVDYFTHLFKCGRYIQALQATANFIRDGQDLNYQNFCLVDLPLPPREEQIEIARFLDSELAKLESLTDKATVGIELLHERRTALISAAVTGKIDVRGWQPPPAAADGAHGRVNGSG